MIVCVLSLFLFLTMGAQACSTDDREQDIADVSYTGQTYIVRTQELPSERDGMRIYGLLYLPEGRTGKLPTVIFSHGLAGTNASVAAYAHVLATQGYACYCFDFCGGAPSNRSDGETTEMSIFTEQADLEAVMENLLGQEFVDAENLFLMGTSQGGMVSALTAAAHPETIRGLVLLYPAFCIQEDMTALFPSFSDVPETYYFQWLNIGRPYFEHLYGFDPYAVIGSYKKEVLILHGDNDGIVPISYSRRAVETYSSARLETFRGAGHGFYGNDFEAAAGFILEYMSEHLNHVKSRNR